MHIVNIYGGNGAAYIALRVYINLGNDDTTHYRLLAIIRLAFSKPFNVDVPFCKPKSIITFSNVYEASISWLLLPCNEDD